MTTFNHFASNLLILLMLCCHFVKCCSRNPRWKVVCDLVPSESFSGHEFIVRAWEQPTRAKNTPPELSRVLIVCEILMKEKNSPVTPWSHRTKLCAFRCLISIPQILNQRSRNQIRGKLLRSRKLLHFRGSCFSNVLYYQPLPITRNQERFYDNNYFE